MCGGMPVALLAGRSAGGSGHLLFSTQVLAASGIVLYEHTQLFRTAVVVQFIRERSPWLLAQVGQR